MLAGILGVLALFGAAEADGTGLVIAALRLFGVAAWLSLTATESVSGGIAVRFGSVSNRDWVTDAYRLPEGTSRDGPRGCESRRRDPSPVGYPARRLQRSFHPGKRVYPSLV